MNRLYQLCWLCGNSYELKKLSDAAGNRSAQLVPFVIEFSFVFLLWQKTPGQFIAIAIFFPKLSKLNF
jgi:hypothetical protein